MRRETAKRIYAHGGKEKRKGEIGRAREKETEGREVGERQRK